MENDVLKNKMAPWQENGRWYHAHITQGGLDTAYTDDYLVNNLTIKENGDLYLNDATRTIIDYEIRVNSCLSPSQQSFTKKIYAEGMPGKTSAAGFPWSSFVMINADVWLFIGTFY